jgi:hypothetical protein
VVELRTQRPQARFDIAKALAKSQLSECHAQELIAATEMTQAMVAAVTLHACVELMPWNQVHQLSEDQPFGRHARPLSEKNPEKGASFVEAFSDRARRVFDASPWQRATSDKSPKA